MKKLIVTVAVCAAMVGAALAQVEASSSTYFLDVDPARYAGPAGQRLMLRVDDQPRSVNLGAQDQICVQLQRVSAGTDSEVIKARVRAMRPGQTTVEVRVVGPDISPGTFRSTPWGMLLRAVPKQTEAPMIAKPVGTDDAPVCTL